MLKRRTAVLYILMLAVMGLVIFRLYAVMSYGKAEQVLSGQYIRRLDAAERRGMIYDRNGIPINNKKDGYICIVDPGSCTDTVEVSEKLSEYSGLAQSEIYDRMLERVPFVIITEECFDASGTVFYPRFENVTLCAPHVVGYTDIDGKGISGIEKYFNVTLSGKFAGSVRYGYMSDASGASLENGGSCVYDSGYSENSGIYLTLDSELQSFCSELVGKTSGSGAVCVTDTESGDILAMVSFPEFDTENVAKYLDSEKGELVNRCLAGATPGSIFKTVIAAAALEKDASLCLREYECKGSIVTADGEVIPCHKSEGHGLIDMKEAYAQSCNPYFIDLANYIGDESIRSTAKKLGLVSECTLDGIFGFGNSIPEYSGGVSSYGGYLANLAIGQGKTLVSPLSICVLYSCAVTGKRQQPGLMLKICEGERVVREYDRKRKCENVLSEETTEYLREMMLYCVSDGLGRDAKPKKNSAGGKTATAQTGRYEEGKEILNCWFCGVYPGEKPKYTICVLYSGIKNGNEAKVIFGKICDKLEDMNIKN